MRHDGRPGDGNNHQRARSDMDCSWSGGFLLSHDCTRSSRTPEAVRESEETAQNRVRALSAKTNLEEWPG